MIREDRRPMYTPVCDGCGASKPACTTETDALASMREDWHRVYWHNSGEPCRQDFCLDCSTKAEELMRSLDRLGKCPRIMRAEGG